MARVIEDAKAAAEWVAKALTASGYRADFSLPSLFEIDRFFDEHSKGGKAVPGGLLSSDIGGRLFAIGAYVGEVIRRAKGGEWRGDDKNPRAEAEIALHLPDGTICWPVQRTMKRFTEGRQESLGAYGTALKAL